MIGTKESHGASGGYRQLTFNPRASTLFLVSQELRTPPFSLAQFFLPAGPPDQAQLLAFWDYGSVRDAKFTPGSNPTKLSSLGVGVRYTFARNLDFRIDYGIQQRAVPGAASPSQLLQGSGDHSPVLAHSTTRVA
jgi:hemolysin activation/secretion protein